ncbi:S1/P1 nuclease [Rhodoferax sp.]|uniref:S1/P1 nuclease n=1 Tax=Rhodoferax sp. TaxID=50421 RepID=UPI00374D3783
MPHLKHMGLGIWLLVCASLLPLSAFAWGHQGHMVVGALADQLLTPQARAGLQKDLGLTLQQAAPWADCAKGVGLGPRGFEYAADERWPSPACTRFETAQGTKAMQDYARRNWNTCGQPRDCHKAYHYTDVAYQHAEYLAGYVGANDHDLVHAINAAIAKLQGRPVPRPFSIASRGEALLLLAHFIGDLHQPLHVGAVYLDAQSEPVDPDVPGHSEVFETRGGNSLDAGHGSNLHALWDDIPDKLRADAIPASLLQEARALRRSRAAVGRWAQIWASDSVRTSTQVFAGLRFSPDAEQKGSRMWTVAFDDEAAYRDRLEQLQLHQLAKAGSRLAQLLNALYPAPR